MPYIVPVNGMEVIVSYNASKVKITLKMGERWHTLWVCAAVHDVDTMSERGDKKY